jgi:TonB family protein
MLTGLAFLVAQAANCSSDPAVVKLADPQLSKAYYQRLTGSVWPVAAVAVTIDARGNVTEVRVIQSTTDSVLDDAAVDAAKRSSYDAGADSCTPAGGTFILQYNFANIADRGKCPVDATATTTVMVIPPSTAWYHIYDRRYVSLAVTIGADGKYTTSRIVQSSGSDAMDRAAIESARESVYFPKAVRHGDVCMPVSGTYLFRVTYDPNS